MPAENSRILQLFGPRGWTSRGLGEHHDVQGAASPGSDERDLLRGGLARYEAPWFVGVVLRLTLAGLDTLTTSSLCRSCPYGPSGCCVAPPRYGLADVAWVVRSGGKAFLLEAIARGDLTPMTEGLAITRRVRGEAGASCTFFAEGEGCTIAHALRPTTCNHYVCDRALEDAEREGLVDEAARTRTMLERLVPELAGLDAALVEGAKRLGFPGCGVDGAFLDALVELFEATRSTSARSPHDVG